MRIFLAILLTLFPSFAFATPSIIDTVPLTFVHAGGSTSYSATYTVPGGGSNNVFVFFTAGTSDVPTVTLNGQSLSMNLITGTIDRANYTVGTLVAPTTGTLVVTRGAGQNNNYDMEFFTVKDADQTSPLDTNYDVVTALGLTITNSIVTTVDNDLVIANVCTNNQPTVTWGSDTSFTNPAVTPTFSGCNGQIIGAYQIGGTAGTKSMTADFNLAVNDADLPMFAIKPFVASAAPSIFSRILVFFGF